MSYKQLIEGQRYQIEAYLREIFSYREIGKRLSVSHSTICREVKRDQIRDNHYLPEVAQAKALTRCCQAAKFRISELTITFVEFGLNEKWSPEQIAGVGKITGHHVSLGWIYGYVQRDKLSGGKLYKQLRQSRRRYRKCSCAKRVIIPNRVGIDHRPAIVNKKKRFSDWEADTVLDKQGTGAIVCLVEPRSKLYLIRRVPAKSEADVARAMVGVLWKYRGHVRIMTADNSSKLCDHELVAEKLRTKLYFANPYSSWECG